MALLTGCAECVPSVCRVLGTAEMPVESGSLECVPSVPSENRKRVIGREGTGTPALPTNLLLAGSLGTLGTPHLAVCNDWQNAVPSSSEHTRHTRHTRHSPYQDPEAQAPDFAIALAALARVQGEAGDVLASQIEDLADAYIERLAIIAADAPDVPEHDARQAAALEIGAEFARRFIRKAA